jgi:4-oxalocrotonate tautomerase
VGAKRKRVASRLGTGINERRRQMPVITIDIGNLDKEKKANLVRELTAKASEVTQIPAEKFIVLINEMERDNIGVGGKLLSEILIS